MQVQSLRARMLILKPVLKLKWVGLQGSRGERWLLLLKESLARYSNGRLWFPCRPSHPLQANNEPRLVESSSSSPPIQLGPIVRTSSAFTTTTIRAHSDQVSRISRERPLSVSCRRASVAARIPATSASNCVPFVNKFATTFRLLFAPSKLQPHPFLPVMLY